MSSRAWRGLSWSLCAAAALALGSIVPRAARAEEPPGGDYLVSEEGHPFRVRFDPASRIWAGASGSFAYTPEGRVETTLELDVGIGYRAIYSWGEGIDSIVWQIDHRWLAGRLFPPLGFDG